MKLKPKPIAAIHDMDELKDVLFLGATPRQAERIVQDNIPEHGFNPMATKQIINDLSMAVAYLLRREFNRR